MEEKQKQEQVERAKQALAQEQANRKLLKLNLIETVSSIFDKYEELLQGFISLQNENNELKRLLEDYSKEPLPTEKPVKELLKRKKNKKQK